MEETANYVPQSCLAQYKVKFGWYIYYFILIIIGMHLCVCNINEKSYVKLTGAN